MLAGGLEFTTETPRALRSPCGFVEAGAALSHERGAGGRFNGVSGCVTGGRSRLRSYDRRQP